MRGEFALAEMLATPWALRRDVLAGHARVCAAWLAGHSALPFDGARADVDTDGRPAISAFEARRRESNARIGGSGIAVIPVFGTIVQRAGMMTEWCGGTSTQQVSAALADAMRDESVGQILLEIDSPGGSVYGVGELADEIVAARKIKPVVAIANSVAASAAYWIAASAGEVYVTPGGDVGSIGVWMAHEDMSAALQEAGVNISLISAGKYKTEGNPYGPLGDEARAFLQSRVDDYYNTFTRAVARGRGVPIDAVRGGMGEGRVIGAQAALEQKMVDGIATVAEVVQKMQRDAKAQRSARQARADLEQQRLALLALG